jgi:hypothetical protein
MRYKRYKHAEYVTFNAVAFKKSAKAAGMSLKEVARKYGIPGKTLYGYFRKGRIPRPVLAQLQVIMQPKHGALSVVQEVQEAPAAQHTPHGGSVARIAMSCPVEALGHFLIVAQSMGVKLLGMEA